MLRLFSRLKSLPFPASDRDTGQTSKIEVISADKAYEMEFLYAREEIRVRMDYNRRLFAGQLTLIASIAVAYISLTSKAPIAEPSAFQVIAIIGIFINSALVLENGTNNTHIASAANFMHSVLNAKYTFFDSDALVYSWESFLIAERQLSPNKINRYLFLLDATLILNVVMSIISIYLFCVGIRYIFFIDNIVRSVMFFVGVCLLSVTYLIHFRSDRSWRMLVQQ